MERCPLPSIAVRFEIEPNQTNRLASEKSPYLLQHAHNPVDWFAWNDEAFSEARRLNRPVFLSIGYSTCHWCHVMERESFENEQIAEILNRHFVSIKIDREERPDIDRIYMLFVQATTGQGGWPLNVFLTPQLKPFFGGTYFPPDDRYGRPGFPRILQQIQQLWETRQHELVHSATELESRLGELAVLQPSADDNLGPDLIRNAGAVFKQTYDPRHGGFGGAPKFPQPSQPIFLLRYARRFEDREAERMVLHTCDAMAAGGIHDQLGGGFARYSVDAQWLVPHFEKMLYDNAQLVHLYLDAALVARRSAETLPRAVKHTDVARKILRYILRDMTHPDGGFYSAEDADSEGHEGKFYCWTLAELQSLLKPAEFEAAVRHFGITAEGNFIDHSHPQPLPGLNVLRVVEEIPDNPRLQSAIARMTEARSRRIRPHLDDKVLASWNGLMLGAVARTGAVLGDDSLLAAADRNLAFLQSRLWQPAATPGSSPGILYHRWRDGQRDSVQLQDAYAFLVSGVVDLYEATLKPGHLEFAIELADAMIEKFYDRENGAFWKSAADAPDVILRLKDDYDGAEPSGNSVAVLALLKLAAITGRRQFTECAANTLRLFARRLKELPQAVSFLLHAVDFHLQEPLRVVVAGDPDSAAARELLRAAHSVYHPNKVILGNRGPVDEFSRTLPDGKGAMVYLCAGTECQPPTSEPGKVREMLG